MPELITTEELEGMFEDTGGALVEYQGQSTYGHLDRSEVAILEGDHLDTKATNPAIRVATGKLVGLRVGNVIQHDGVSYEIRDHGPIEDGGETSIKVKDL